MLGTDDPHDEQALPAIAPIDTNHASVRTGTCAALNSQTISVQRIRSCHRDPRQRSGASFGGTPRLGLGHAAGVTAGVLSPTHSRVAPVRSGSGGTRWKSVDPIIHFLGIMV